MKACLKAKVATAEVVHIDASLIRADVSWESLVERHASDVIAGNRSEEEIEAEKKGRQSGRHKKVSLTDADASMATTARNRRLEPCYKQHTAVDDERGVVLDVAVTTGEVNEGDLIEAQIDAVQKIADRAISTVTADTGYAYAKVYGGLERRGIPGEERTDQEPHALASLPLRRPARHCEVPAGAGSAPEAAGQAWPLLLFQGQGLRTLSAQGRVSVEGASQQGGGNPDHSRQHRGCPCRNRIGLLIPGKRLRHSLANPDEAFINTGSLRKPNPDRHPLRTSGSPPRPPARNNVTVAIR